MFRVIEKFGWRVNVGFPFLICHTARLYYDSSLRHSDTPSDPHAGAPYFNSAVKEQKLRIKNEKEKEKTVYRL